MEIFFKKELSLVESIDVNKYVERSGNEGGKWGVPYGGTADKPYSDGL